MILIDNNNNTTFQTEKRQNIFVWNKKYLRFFGSSQFSVEKLVNTEKFPFNRVITYEFHK